MDMSFLYRAERMLVATQPVRIEHQVLVATLSAQREAHASLAGRSAAAPAPAGQRRDEPMVELLLGGPGWKKALSAQRGCFSRAEAGRRINVP